jgi:filamentous hemagglutinin family protein
MKMNKLCDFGSRFRILKGGKISLVVSAMVAGTTISFASPSDGVVTSGTANISLSGNTTNINQTTDKASINWNKFNIASNETVNFNQPNSSSITLNRVVGNEKSVIDGALNANGQVWILNSNGILFNKNAKINTAGLIATTAELSDTNFQNGNYDFKNNSSESVINLGTIEVSNNGSVVLAANEVINLGTIKAVRGKVYLTAANEYTVNLNGNSLVNLIVTKGVLDAMVENTGTISANGGEIYLTTNAVNELLKGVVNNTGIIEANSLDGLMGKVELFAHGGEVQVGGTIEAKDGFVETSGKDFTIKENTTIKTAKWLIDPVNVTIDSDLASTIVTALDTADVTIETTNSGSSTVDTTGKESGTEGNIYVNHNITTNNLGGLNRTLTLDADNDIIFDDGITIDATQNSNTNKLNVVLNSDNDGDFTGNIVLKGSLGTTIKTNNGDLTFNGKIESNVANESPLLVEAGTGTVSFENDVGETNPLRSMNITGQYVDFGSKTDYITTLNEQIYNGDIRLTGTAQFENASFEDGTTGWVVTNSQVYLNGVSTISDNATPDDTKFPITTDGSSAPYDTSTFSGSFTSTISADTDDGSGTSSLQLTSSGVVNDGYAITHGGYVVSDSTVSLEEGGTVSFKWKASGGGDAYDVFGYILDVDTGATQVILNETGATYDASTDWDTASITADTAGNYKFIFVSGTWDATGGRGIGANLYIDDIKAFSGKKFSSSAINFANNIDSGSNPLTIKTDNLTLGGNISGTGELLIETYTDGTNLEIGKTVANASTSVLSLTDEILSKIQDGFSNITLGNTSTGKVTVDSTIIQDNLNIKSGSSGIELVDTLNIGTNNLTLESTGIVNDTGDGSIIASSLGLLGSGSFSLDSVNNDVDTLAAGSEGSKIASLTYVDSDDLIIGSAAGLVGINSSSQIDISTLTGNLTFSENISTTDTSASAVTLNAGKSITAGTSTGGDIIKSGSSTITVGTGGSSTLYTGSLTGSSSLANYIGSGSERFRYNSDEINQNYTTILAAGNNLIYREKPLIKVAAVSNSITYGTSLTSNYSLINATYKNGDNESRAGISGTATFNIANENTSTGGYAIAGTHDLIYNNGLLSALGYGFEDDTSSSNELTVTKKAITVSANDLLKVYGQTDATLTYTARGLVGSDTLTGTLKRAAGEDAGKYTISQGALANSNYIITFNNGVYTITEKPSNNKVEDTITAIVNQTVLKVKAPQIDKPSSEKATQEDIGNPTNTQAAEGNQGPKSVIEIVNGGVNLPAGVEQIFFTSNDGIEPDANTEKTEN